MRLEAFRGNWILTRTIEDRRESRSGQFSGTARFGPAAQGLDYREDGILVLGGASYRASRRYFWSQANDDIEVHFADGRFFHRFRPGADQPAGEHPCGEDFYRVTYDFSRWPHWRAEWRVTGPAKDYILVSEYRPTGQNGKTTA